MSQLLFFWKPFFARVKEGNNDRHADRIDVGVDMREQRANTVSRRVLLTRCAMFGAGTFFSTPFHQQMGAVVWGEDTPTGPGSRTYSGLKNSTVNYDWTKTPEGMRPSQDPLKPFMVSSTKTISMNDPDLIRRAMAFFDERMLDEGYALAPSHNFEIPQDGSNPTPPTATDANPAVPQMPRSFSTTLPMGTNPSKSPRNERIMGGVVIVRNNQRGLSGIAREIHDDTNRLATEVGFNTALLGEAHTAAKKNDSTLKFVSETQVETQADIDECEKALRVIREKNCCREEQNKLITQQCQKLCQRNQQTVCRSGGRSGRWGNFLRWVFIGLIIAIFIVGIVMMFSGGGGAALGSVAFF